MCVFPHVPFKLQIFFNGHTWLSNELTGKKYWSPNDGQCFFITIGDWGKAQKMSDNLSVKTLHKKLKAFAGKYCPVHKYQAGISRSIINANIPPI